MFEFSKLFRSSPINLRLLLSKNFPNSFIKRRNYNQNKKSKKIILKQKQKSNVLNKRNKTFQMNDNTQYTITREWAYTNDKQKSNFDGTQGKNFIVMTYNILAQDLLEAHMHLYKNNNPQDLEWNRRLLRISSEILILRPHILCLQEVQNDHLQVIINSLNELEFDYVYKRKTGDTTDGCAIFYNRKIFGLIKSHTIEYYQSNVDRLDRPNIALAVKLLVNDNPDLNFLVVTTHLLYNPKREDVRLAQVQLLLAEIDMLSFNGYFNENDKQPRRIPIILTGDFNFQPYSAPYRLLQTGILQYKDLTKNRLQHPENCNQILVDKLFLPQQLGITDNCQHIDVLFSRYKNSSRINNSDIKNIFKYNEDIIIKNPNLFSSGILTHSLELNSVYKHTSKNGTDKEASTNQDEWITVDFIFYNKNKYENNILTNDCNLQLLSWYLLPPIKECEKLKYIPNSQIGSDHLALAAEFRITKTD